MIDELISSIVEFCYYCRENGLNIGVKETLDAIEVVKLDLLYDKDLLKYGFRTVLCTSKVEFDKFDELFENFWSKLFQIDPPPAIDQTKYSQTVVKNKIPLLSLLSNQLSNNDEEDKRDISASPTEKLRKTDFSKLTLNEKDQLHELAEQLWRRMSLRLTRRYKQSNKKKQIDLRRTIRQNLSKGGTPFNLKYKARKRIKPKVVILLDVSGSMDRYSFFLLRFIYVLHIYFQRISSFIFSTRLLNITQLLNTSKLSETLELLEEEGNMWSSGTTMGECFVEFNNRWGSKFLSGKPIVMIFSDGLETGEVAQLYRQLSKIKSKAKKLIWVTPLLGMKNYQPITRGLSSILPLIDVFTSAHNVDSLLELEKYLTDVL